MKTPPAPDPFPTCPSWGDEHDWMDAMTEFSDSVAAWRKRHPGDPRGAEIIRAATGKEPESTHKPRTPLCKSFK